MEINNLQIESTIQKQATMIPMVVERQGNSERSFDLFSRLMKDRIILLNGGVDDGMASVAIAQMLFLEKEESEQPIYMYINSPGGSVTAGMGMFDTMQKVSCPIVTICTGLAASMGAFLLAAGDVRVALPNSEVMIHQPLGGARGQATDIEITAKNILRTKEKLNRYLSQFTGQAYEKVVQDCERDYWMNAQEAKAYGLVDVVYQPQPKKFDRQAMIDGFGKKEG